MTLSRETSLPSFSTPVQFVKGIGPKKAAALAQVGVRDVLDLFFYAPRRYLDRTALVTIADLRRGNPPASNLPSTPGSTTETPAPDVRRDVTVVGEVRSFRVVGFGRKSRFVLVLADKSGSMQCVWFGGVQYWRKAFRVGEILAVSGQPSWYSGVLQFVHPDLDRLSPGGEEDIDWGGMLNTGSFVPLYPSGQDLARVGLDSRGFRRILHSAIRTHLASVPETLPDDIIRARSLLPLKQAIRNVHSPETLQAVGDGLTRLKYEEFFHFQLKLALRRQVRGTDPGIPFDVKSSTARRLVDSLPFALTKAQVRVIREISDDMARPAPMNRLLQGDVGSGKTVVALVSMLIAVDNGCQAVFLAPTEILAEQHHRTLSSLLKGIPVNTRLLVGGQKASVRKDILEEARSGGAGIIVGTHAIFEEDVTFRRLGLVVIDEQHRFGVMQRALMRQKGENPDVLVMTATPIPRTLSLTLYGDLDVSVIDELPLNRKPITTLLKHDDGRASVYEFVRGQVKSGRQAYFVYPLIEESDKVDLKAATVHYEHLSKEVFPDLRVGLIHGRLPAEEKERIMSAFKAREIDVLAATTVIEVGIDVPNASVMVIEEAERFGLSQLHQLRGRVGRGSSQSYCILIARKWIADRAGRIDLTRQDFSPLEEERLAERRLAAMVATTDGFAIAEVDLQLRGPGDFFGTRQSGMPEFKVANILTDANLLTQARQDAFDLIRADPQLQNPTHRVLADQLRLRFHEEIALLRVG